MKISMSERMFDRLTIEDSISAASKIGYDGIEVRPLANHLPVDTTQARLREVKKRVDDAGLEVNCIACMPTTYVRTDDADCRKQLDTMKTFIEFAHELSSPSLRHWAGNVPAREATHADWARASEWVAKAAEIAGAAGISLGLELHHGTLLDSVDRGIAFVRAIGLPNLMLIHDAVNLYHDGVEYGRVAIHRLKGLLLELHIKDIVELVDDTYPHAGYDYRGRRLVDRPIGQGGVDQHSIFKGLAEIGYDRYVVVECGLLPGMDAYAVAEHSYRAIRQVLADLGM